MDSCRMSCWRWAGAGDQGKLREDVRNHAAGFSRGSVFALETITSDRAQLLQVFVYIADENDSGILNELQDAWVPADHPPVRAMTQVGFAKACKVAMVVTAATWEA
jgi:enamine deaminase RidA (YjgF/YER057c/UK114 family)